MYEYAAPMGMGIWGMVGPAAGLAAAGYALYRARRAEQQQAAEIGAAASAGTGSLAETCQASTGSPCSSPQISDICNNLSYDQLTDQHWTECYPFVTASHLCRLSEGQRCSSADVATFCNVLPSGRRPRDCESYIANLEVQSPPQQQLAMISKAGGSASDEGMKGLGWTAVEAATCNEIQGGHPVCFRNTTIGRNPPEQDFARNQGCLPLDSGARCETSPYGNPGIQWCCPEGWPRESGSGPLQPGEFPPAPPGVMNKIQFWKQYWWFWVLASGIPVAGYFGYQYLKDEGYIGGSPKFAVLEDVEVGGWGDY